MSGIYDLAVDLVRAQAARMLNDSPQRTGSPAYEEPPPAFDELSMQTRLDIAETVCRREPFFSARDEMLIESDQYQSLVTALLDSSISNEKVGLMARQIALAYLQKVAEAHYQNLSDFA